MRKCEWWSWVVAAVLLGGVAGCGQVLQAGGGGSRVPPEYAALPDTTVCVVDRSAPNGLREIPAKIAGSGIVLLVDGQVQPLSAVHPVNVIAGYAGQEPWLIRGDPISFRGTTFVRYLGERRIAVDLLRRVGEHQGILLFAGADASSIDALYVPTAPGCIFQGYVREDLVRR